MKSDAVELRRDLATYHFESSYDIGLAERLKEVEGIMAPLYDSVCSLQVEEFSDRSHLRQIEKLQRIGTQVRPFRALAPETSDLWAPDTWSRSVIGYQGLRLISNVYCIV